MTERETLAHIIHDDSSRNRGVALRRGQALKRRAPAPNSTWRVKGASPLAVRYIGRHRACEVERPLDDPGAKKEYRNEF